MYRRYQLRRAKLTISLNFHPFILFCCYFGDVVVRKSDARSENLKVCDSRLVIASCSSLKQETLSFFNQVYKWFQCIITETLESVAVSLDVIAASSWWQAQTKLLARPSFWLGAVPSGYIRLVWMQLSKIFFLTAPRIPFNIWLIDTDEYWFLQQLW